MNWQVFDALGIFFGYTANLIVSGTSAHVSSLYYRQDLLTYGQLHHGVGN